MMDIGKDLQDAYECGRQDALNELMEYTYAMLTAEKFGLQHKIKSMMADRKTEPQKSGYCNECKWYGDKQVCGRCRSRNLYTPKDEPQTEVTTDCRQTEREGE